MATKIMLVLDNKDDQDFLEKVLIRLKYEVISMKKGVDLSEQLIDHFPDVVFASTLGRNAKILNALGKIKEVRGKPKLVFVKLKNEKNTLTSEQKNIIDGTIYTPIDPFKLIDLLSNTTEVDIIELRRRYNEMLEQDRGGRKGGGRAKSKEGDNGDPDYGTTQVIGKKRKQSNTEIEKEDPDFYGTVTADDFADESSGEVQTTQEDETPPVTASTGEPEGEGVAESEGESSSSLIHDSARAKKYKEWTDKMKASGDQPKPIDVQKLREKQQAQAEEISEDATVKKDRKHFLKTLFSMDPNSIKKD